MSLRLSCCERCLVRKAGLSGWDIRKLSIMLDLILEVSQLCDNLFALVGPGGVGTLRDGAVRVVDGLCLFGEQRVSQAKAKLVPVKTEGVETELTIITGHLSRAVVHPNEVLSAVE